MDKYWMITILFHYLCKLSSSFFTFFITDQPAMDINEYLFFTFKIQYLFNMVFIGYVLIIVSRIDDWKVFFRAGKGGFAMFIYLYNVINRWLHRGTGN